MTAKDIAIETKDLTCKFGSFTAVDRLNIKVHSGEKRSRVDEMIKEMNLEDKRHEFSANLSGGLKQRLALGCAILHKPRLLFLDEPTSAVDPIARRSFWQIIHTLALGGTTMVVTTHFMEEAEHCDEMVFLDAGKTVAMGTPPELKSSICGTLVSIASDDSIKLREEIKRLLPVQDAYIFGRELRVLVAPEDLPLLKNWNYNIIEPTMEDVFSYYLDKKGGGAL